MFTVVISEKGGAERRETFDRAELSVGRVQGNDLLLPKGNVSKRHARLLHREGRFIVTDLNSTNGTYVNRRRISQATIVRRGDRIYIGDFVLRIESDEDGVAAESTGNSALHSAPVSSAYSSVEPISSNADLPSSLSAVAPDELASSYPQLPAPPRLPSGARLDSVPDPQSSSRLSVAEPVSPSLLERSYPTGQDEAIDTVSTAQRRALALLVARVKETLGLQVVPDEVDPQLTSRIERAIEEQVIAIQSTAEFASFGFAQALVRAARAELIELGPVTALLADPSVTELTVAGHERVVAQREGQVISIEPVFSSEAAVALALRRLCRRAGTTWDESQPIVECRLPDGARVSAVLGGVAPGGGLLVIRKPRRISVTLEALVRRGTISRAMATFIHQCVSARLNILVVGPADSGQAALLSGLCSAVGDAQVIALQEFEDVMLQRGGLARLSIPDDPRDARHVLRLASGVPGGRLLIELTSPALTSSLVQAVGEGADGVLAAMRAPNLRRALTRISADLVGAQPGLSVEAARELVASSFDVLVEIAQLRDGRQRVLRMSEIAGANERELVVQDIFTFAIERTAAGGSIEGTFSSSGMIPRVVEEMRARGLALEASLFTRPPSR